MDDFQSAIAELIAAAQDYEPCISVMTDDRAIEVIIDTSINYYGEHIVGEGFNMCLYREQETNKVVGCRIPLRDNTKLAIFHDGPIKVNDGFLKSDRS